MSDADEGKLQRIREILQEVKDLIVKDKEFRTEVKVNGESI